MHKHIDNFIVHRVHPIRTTNVYRERVIWRVTMHLLLQKLKPWYASLVSAVEFSKHSEVRYLVEIFSSCGDNSYGW